MTEGSISPIPDLTGQDAFDEAVRVLDYAWSLMASYLDDDVLHRISILAKEIDLQSPKAKEYLGAKPLPERVYVADPDWLTVAIQEGLRRAKAAMAAKGD